MSVSRRPFFRHLPRWVYASRDYDALTGGEKWILHRIAESCRMEVGDDSGSRRGCFVSDGLYRRAGCSRATFWRTQRNLRRLRFVVKVGQGGGRDRWNELAIPGALGALDRIEVGDDPRFKLPRKTVSIRDRTRLNLKPNPSQNETETVSKRDGLNRVRLRRFKPTNPLKNAKISADFEAPLSSSSLRVSSLNLGAPFPNGQNEGQPEGKNEQSNDDEELTRLLPDDASAEQRKAVLVKLGIDGGRSYKLAQHSTPRLIRDAIRRASPHRGSVENPGAYLASLIDDDLAREAAEQNREREGQRATARDEFADALEAVRDPARVPDAELAALAKLCQLADFVGGPDALRTDPAFGPLIAKAWLATQTATELAGDDHPEVEAVGSTGGSSSVSSASRAGVAVSHPLPTENR